ncbi:cation transporter [Wenzhouxiangella sp. XN79A]|uniref:cation diffusion facilitator family transporter n=1 Tax=Wenzhouxiangella sp. XN79A TaxID=2724193 RepID=UPI00144A8907|nr:cation diffusion facilitator family transporter [Wenzhouxiangella sp. XN79A]NKI35334.1 cation transporter [Wenzhouxiangella sp. XN79A]
MHEHDHHSHDHGSGRALRWAVVITLAFAAVEFVVGWWGGSLALMADAGHMLTDSTSLGLAALAAWIATRPADAGHSWGHGRAEIIAALINGTAMLVLVAVIVYNAIQRFQDPVEVKGVAVLAVATIGLIVNLAVLKVLHGGEGNLNVRGAMLHVIGDLLGSVAAIASGAIILLTGWTPIDPILSLLICSLILVAAVRLLKTALTIVMEGVPARLDLEEVRAAMREDDEVVDVHDLHIWQISSERIALSAHVVVHDLARWPVLLARTNAMLLDRFAIDHPTLQVEPHDGLACKHANHQCHG